MSHVAIVARVTVKEGRAVLAEILQDMEINSVNRTDTASHRPTCNLKTKPQPLIEVKGLQYVYPNGQLALRDIDLRIFEGEFIAS